MRFAHYKELCSHILGVPVSTIHITQDGEIKLSYQDRVPVVNEGDVASIKLIQACLDSEFAGMQAFEKVKALTSKLQGAQATRQEFFDGIGHELRTPLNAVLNLSEVLTEKTLPAEASKIVSALHRSSQQVSRLVEDALSLNALDRGQMKVNLGSVQPRQFLSGLEEEFAPIGLRYGAKFVCKADDNLPSEVLTDPDKLAQVVNNLIYYGFLKQEETFTMSVSISWVNPGLSISVCAPDLGLGLAETEALLRPWPDMGGGEKAGLSMSVANTLIELMGGNLKVSDHPDSGCILRAWIPAKLAQRQKVDDSPVVHQTTKEIKILAADDDPTSLLVLEHVIGNLGYQMSSVESGTTVLKQLATEDFDLLLLDLHMPGMDGFEVAEAVKKELKKDVPIVAMSADISDLARARAAEVGMIEFIPKPLKRERLSQILKRVLGL